MSREAQFFQLGNGHEDAKFVSYNIRCIKNPHMGAGELAWWVECLLCKHEDPQDPSVNLGVMVNRSNPDAELQGGKDTSRVH